MCRWMGSMGDPILMGNSWKNVADFFDFSARSGDLPSLQHRPCQRRGWKNSRGLSWLGWLHMTYLPTLKERHTSSKALRLSEQEAAEVRFMEQLGIYTPNLQQSFNGEVVDFPKQQFQWGKSWNVRLDSTYIYMYIQSHGSSWWFSLSADLIRLDGLVVCCLSRPRVNETCCPILSQVAQNWDPSKSPKWCMGTQLLWYLTWRLYPSIEGWPAVRGWIFDVLGNDHGHEDFGVDQYRQRFSWGSEGLRSPTKVLNVMSFCLELHSSAQLWFWWVLSRVSLSCAGYRWTPCDPLLIFRGHFGGWNGSDFCIASGKMATNGVASTNGKARHVSPFTSRCIQWTAAFWPNSMSARIGTEPNGLVYRSLLLNIYDHMIY